MSGSYFCSEVYLCKLKAYPSLIAQRRKTMSLASLSLSPIYSFASSPIFKSSTNSLISACYFLSARSLTDPTFPHYFFKLLASSLDLSVLDQNSLQIPKSTDEGKGRLYASTYRSALIKLSCIITTTFMTFQDGHQAPQVNPNAQCMRLLCER